MKALDNARHGHELARKGAKRQATHLLDQQMDGSRLNLGYRLLGINGLEEFGLKAVISSPRGAREGDGIGSEFHRFILHVGQLDGDEYGVRSLSLSTNVLESFELCQ